MGTRLNWKNQETKQEIKTRKSTWQTNPKRLAKLEQRVSQASQLIFGFTTHRLRKCNQRPHQDYTETWGIYTLKIMRKQWGSGLERSLGSDKKLGLMTWWRKQKWDNKMQHKTRHVTDTKNMTWIWGYKERNAEMRRADIKVETKMGEVNY